MPKQTDISIENRKAFLVMPEVKFKQALEERIRLGKELLKIQVTRNTTPYGMAGYGRYISQEERQYNKQEIDSFKKEYYKWSDFNSELFKQAFDYPNNEYQREYEDTGVWYAMGNEDVMEEYHGSINKKVAMLERMIEKLPLIPQKEEALKKVATKMATQSSNKVFIVHGHDNNTRNEAELLVKQLGFEPVVLFKKPNMGDTIIEKLLRESSEVSFAIVLYTKWTKERLLKKQT